MEYNVRVCRYKIEDVKDAEYPSISRLPRFQKLSRSDKTFESYQNSNIERHIKAYQDFQHS